EKERSRRYQQAGQIKTRVETIATSQYESSALSLHRQQVNWIPALVFYALQALLLIPAELSFLVGFVRYSFFWLAVAVLALIPAYIAWGILHYSCWKALPERYRQTTPDKAVG